MASNTTTIRKLQRALNSRNQKVMYCTSQFWSEEQDRPVTMYHIKQSRYDVEKHRHKNVELFSSCSQIEIVLFLRDFWYKLNDKPLPMNNEVWNAKREIHNLFQD